LQSAKEEHAAQRRLMQVRPLLHPGKNPGKQPPSICVKESGAQIPDEHPSPEAQSLSSEQVHCSDVCVAVQVAAGPHWELAVQVVQTWLMQTWPALHWLLVVHVVQPPAAHATQAW
jgi:hypothetical protein